MGVLNVTPDSFSDGGLTFDPTAAIDHGRRLAAEGADLLDVGAESTRPGASPVSAGEQWRRLEPVLKGLLAGAGVPISVDTASAEVAQRALELGVHVINDVTALADPGMAPVVAARGAGVILMHMRGTPAEMQRDPRYEDVVSEVVAWLAARAAAARAQGLAVDQIALDPGIGFGKTVQHNLELLARLDRLAELGRPVVVGLSRKSFLGKLLDLPLGERLEAGLAASAVAVFQGAAILRTHDVKATRRAAAIALALREARARESARPESAPS